MRDAAKRDSALNIRLAASRFGVTISAVAVGLAVPIITLVVGSAIFGDRWHPPSPWDYVLLIVHLTLVFIVASIVWTKVDARVYRRAVLASEQRQASIPRCGGCQYPLAGIPLVNNAVTCPECGDLNRFWPGSQPHAAMVEAVASDHSIARPTETS